MRRILDPLILRASWVPVEKAGEGSPVIVYTASLAQRMGHLPLPSGSEAFTSNSRRVSQRDPELPPVLSEGPGW